MSSSKHAPVRAQVGGRPVACLVCGANEFFDREVKLNSSWAEGFGLGWANKSATGLICTTCGYVHEFAGDALQVQRS